MGAALRGNLDDFAIPEIFQLIGHQRKTGLLEVSGTKGRTRVAFDGGALVWAAPVGEDEFASLAGFLVRCGLVPYPVVQAKMSESRVSARALPDLLVAEEIVEEQDIRAISDLMTRETLFALMAQVGGSFEFLAGPVDHDLPSDRLMVAEQILMDGMRMQDEWKTFAGQLPDEADVLEMLVPVDDYCARLEDGAKVDADRVRLVSHFVNGENSFRNIIDLSRLGTFSAGRLLADLRRAGIVDVVDPAYRNHRRRRGAGIGRVMAWAKFSLAACLPLILLAGVSVGLFAKHLDRLSGPGRSIAQRPLEDARAQFGRQRLHNLLEARRHGTGLWPHGLNFLAQADEGVEGGLTPESASAYYYMRRGDGIVLLAPRR